MLKTKTAKQARQDQLIEIIENDPFVTDDSLSDQLKVSIQTIRLDRMMLGIPELRTRIKVVAKENYNKVRTLSQSEIVGELLDLELNNRAISVLDTDVSMVFEKTQIVKGHHIFAMAESLSLAVIDAEVAITGVANLKYNIPVKAGEKLVAKAKVTQIKENEYYVHVFINAHDEQVFRSKFIMKAV
ncbi:MAG: transcription factor FapR [Clostridiales bacterium]|nr:transcription factor FapR [Clostridiales bacterium]